MTMSYGSKIDQLVIMVCTPDLYYQEFKAEGLEFKKYKRKSFEENRYVLRINQRDQMWQLRQKIFNSGNIVEHNPDTI